MQELVASNGGGGGGSRQMLAQSAKRTRTRRRGSAKTLIAVDVCKGVSKSSIEEERDRGRRGREKKEGLAR